MNSAPQLSIGQCATLACLLEATAPKVGNVHRGADFEDLSFVDFAVSAALIAPAMERAVETGVGAAVLAAVEATQNAVSTNTNLGLVLLIAPLAAVPRERPLRAGVAEVLQSLTPEDSRQVYAAIQRAQAGGLGKVDEMDVAGPAPADLLDAMRSAAGRDLIAREYANDFRLVLDEIVPSLVVGRERGWTLIDTIVRTHVDLLHRHGDSLIARKCGPELALRISAIASEVLDAGQPGDDDYHAALSDLDFFLRSDGHRRNPGATADLLAAGLFAALREGVLAPPWR